MTVPASLSKWAHPPRSNTPRSSSSGPPGPCITPSTETCAVVVSFMVAVPFLVAWSSSGRSGATRTYRCGRSDAPRDPEVLLLARDRASFSHLAHDWTTYAEFGRALCRLIGIERYAVC